MKMVIRADDMGYSVVNDIGAFESIEQGVVTAADVMLDGPNAAATLDKLRGMPWISVGWHAHFWCSPVLPAEKVPSLVQENGRFRTDLHTAEDVDYDEMIAECEAQISLCLDHLGRVPDVGMGGRADSVFGRAVDATCKKYGIVTGFMGMAMGDKVFPASEAWAHRKINAVGMGIAYNDLMTKDIDELTKYDPLNFYLEDRGGLLKQPEDTIAVQFWHPGYLDYFNYREGDYGPNAKYFTTIRIVDVHALTSPLLKAWIREHNIELINFRDALYGTRDYQNHLSHVGSELYVK